MKYVYGPLKSRRLGLSLGISLTPYKICSFDCVYCQLGTTGLATSERKEYANIADILDELKTWLANNPAELSSLNYITISGSGEPTLNVKLGYLINKIKELASVPVAVITNASLISAPEVRHELLAANLLIPSLDAATQDVFERVDRPVKAIRVEEVIEGLVNLRREFKGKIWLEVMLVSGVNDDLRYIKKLKEVIEKINPDKIQLNSPVRATAEENILPVAKEKLKRIQSILGEKAEIL